MASLLKRITNKADALAAGTPEPAGLDDDDPGARRPSARERGRMRRRLRKLVRIRETKLRELGGIVLELKRLDRENPELVERRTEELRVVDDEARGLAAALRDESALDEILVSGISGSCAECGALMSTDDRYCSRCGTQAGVPARPAPDEQPAAGSGNGNHAQVTQELPSS